MMLAELAVAWRLLMTAAGEQLGLWTSVLVRKSIETLQTYPYVIVDVRIVVFVVVEEVVVGMDEVLDG